MLRWTVCVFEGFLGVLSGNTDHGYTLLTGYPGTGVVTERVACAPPMIATMDT